MNRTLIIVVAVACVSAIAPVARAQRIGGTLGHLTEEAIDSANAAFDGVVNSAESNYRGIERGLGSAGDLGRNTVTDVRRLRDAFIADMRNFRKTSLDDLKGIRDATLKDLKHARDTATSWAVSIVIGVGIVAIIITIGFAVYLFARVRKQLDLALARLAAPVPAA